MVEDVPRNLKAIHFSNAWRFNWMIPNIEKNGCLTKHPLKTDCLEFQECDVDDLDHVDDVNSDVTQSPNTE